MMFWAKMPSLLELYVVALVAAIITDDFFKLPEGTTVVFCIYASLHFSYRYVKFAPPLDEGGQ